MKQIVFLFSDVSQNSNKTSLLKSLKRCALIFQVGVHFITGISEFNATTIYENLREHTTRIGYPFPEEIKNRIIFDEKKPYKNDINNLIVKIGLNGDLMEDYKVSE